MSVRHRWTVSWQISVSPPHVPLCKAFFICRQLWSVASHSHMSSISATFCGMLPRKSPDTCWQLSPSQASAPHACRTDARYLLQTASLRQTLIRSKQDPDPIYSIKKVKVKEKSINRINFTSIWKTKGMISLTDKHSDTVSNVHYSNLTGKFKKTIKLRQKRSIPQGHDIFASTDGIAPSFCAEVCSALKKLGIFNPGYKGFLRVHCPWVLL